MEVLPYSNVTLRPYGGLLSPQLQYCIIALKPVNGTVKHPVFKSVLKRRYKVEIPEYFYSGPRKINIVLSQMRMQFCSLKYDLCRRGCIDSASCHCERDDETLTRYFFDCPSYGLQRDQLMQSISRLVLDKC